MQSDWRQVTLGEFVRLQRGHDLTASEQRPGQFPVMGSAGPNGTHAEFKAFGPGVVIGRSGASMGRVHFCETDYWPHNTCLYVTDFLENNPLFAFYKLAELDLARYNSGSAQPSLNRNYIYGMSLWIPSRHIQDQIVRVVHSIDKKIDLYHRINQTLEAMAQAIFQSWFVDFDPVKAKITAKAEGSDPLRAAMSAISGKADAELDALSPEQYEQLAATAVLFPDEMEESELGEIPKGCIAGSLGDICNFTAGSAFSPEHQGSAGGDYPFIKVSDMNLVGNEVFIQSANNYVTQARQLEMKAKLHPQGATVFAKIGVALVSNRRRLLIAPTIIDNNMMSASPIDGKSASYFLYSLLSTIDFNTLVSGTALPYLNVSDLRKIPIVRPLDGVCRAFELKAASIFLMMQKLAAQSVTLASVRGALLPKLLSGEIEVSGLDQG